MITWDRESPPQVRKVPSDRAVMGDLAVGELTFGTTVATNALLERTGVATLLVVTEGFADLVRIRHMARPGLFEPDRGWPDPLCCRVLEVRGRLAADGEEIEPLELPRSWPVEGIESVAVALLHGGRHPEHELQLAMAIREQHPSLHLALGHELSREVGYLSRIETSLVDAAITPVLHEAIRRDHVPPGSQAIQSDGSLVDATTLRAPDAVLSGPAGGVLAVEAIARMSGFPGAVGLDMGGTSTDVCCVEVGSLPRLRGDVAVAGVYLRRPMLEVETIAAGGGSILSFDGTRLRVGPASAGAVPGPQCYGRGGPPTLTDAALALGLVDANAFDPPLDASRIELPGDAAELVELAREAMARAVRRIASARGIDVRELALVSYGGAAGQHAAGVAERLAMHTVLVHPFAAALSAWGQSLAREEHLAVRALWLAVDEVLCDLDDLAEELFSELPPLDDRELLFDLRYRGTDAVLSVPANLDAPDRFHERHRILHGYAEEDAPLEVVNLRARVRGPLIEVDEPDDDPWGLGDRVLTGPTRIDCATTSVVVPQGWQARREHGLLRLDRLQAPARKSPTERTPFGVSLWAARFMAVAETAGETLARTARSVNIRERRDFSCAVFDDQGRLIANAPHIPVHLGAMGETVRDLIANVSLFEPGQSWLSNDPSAGGSHLPDLTVVTPVSHGARTFFVASRGHHADVGGLTPGSMPPHATRLEDEGMVFRNVPLLDGEGRPCLAEIISGSRQPHMLAADLRAQLASNASAARALRELGEPDLLNTWMAHLRDAARESVSLLLPHLPAYGTSRDHLRGVPLAVEVRVADGLLHLDFTGTGGPHQGNLNAPPSVVRAAVLYVLRVLVADDVPLNEGVLELVRLTLPHPSLLSPPPGAAVAGGNVETSQRLVDLLLRALGRRAASQGTMNNLTLGGEGWSVYETLGGGQGASPHASGLSGLQVHMTNTRATDPEVLESRLPLRLHRFALRAGSGGEGALRGGDGLTRELEVLQPASASLLATRRDHGSPGLAGGGPGLPGADYIVRNGLTEPWDGHTASLSPGDRVVVETPGGGGYGVNHARPSGEPRSS